MAGFTPKRRIYILDFEGDEELDGLEVHARSAPIGMVLDLGSMVDAIGELPDPAKLESLPQAEQIRVAAASMSKLRTLVDAYAQVLVSWNYEDEQGRAVPATAEGLLTLDPAHLMRVIGAWKQVVTQVPDAVGKESSGGSPSPVASLPMEPLSPSRAS